SRHFTDVQQLPSVEAFRPPLSTFGDLRYAPGESATPVNLRMAANTQLVLSDLIDALRLHSPGLLRWSGAIASRLRQFDISLGGKASGNANTDALTLADLTIQELLVDGLRDLDPIF